MGFREAAEERGAPEEAPGLHRAEPVDSRASAAEAETEEDEAKEADAAGSETRQPL